MNLEKIEKEVDRTGFCIVENILDKDEVVLLRDQLQIALEDDAKEYGHLAGKRYSHIADLTSHGPAFVKLLENENIYKLFTHFLGKDCILYSYHSNVRLSQDKEAGSDIHRVSEKFPYIEGYHFGLLIHLALDDFTEENGATYYLPGSHRLKASPSEEEFYDNSVPAVLKAGDSVLFHPLCWLATGINKTDNTGYAISPYACRAFLKQRFDFPRMVTPEILSWVGQRGRALLGFEARVPTNLFEYYVPKEKRLYKTGAR